MSNENIKIGQVGLGGWGKFVVRNFSQTDHCELSYICDSTPKTLDVNRKLYPQATATESFDDLLDDESLDAIAIVTPAPMHYDMAKAALLAGKHVYVEKPMTLTAQHAEELVVLADSQERKLMVGHLLEYHPAVEEMKRQIQSGALGEIFYMYCQRLNLGVVRQHENAFWSLAPHDISVICHLFEAEPTSVTATGQCFLQSQIEDVVFASLQFQDGRAAHIHVSWLDPHKERKMVLVGSERMIVFDDMAPAEKLRIFDKSAYFDKKDSLGALQAINVRHGDILIPRVPGPEPLAAETQHFIDAIRNDTRPLSDGLDGLRVVRVLEEVDQQLRHTLPTPLRRAA